MEVDTVDANRANVARIQRFQGGRLPTGRITNATLTIVQAAERPLDPLVRILDECVGSAPSSHVRKLDVTPALGHVHVDGALWAPHPVVLWQQILCARFEPFGVPAAADVDLPFHA